MFRLKYDGQETLFNDIKDLTDSALGISNSDRIANIVSSWAGNAEFGNKISFTVRGCALEISCFNELEKKSALTARDFNWEGTPTKDEWLDLPNEILIPDEVYSDLDDEEDIRSAVLDFVNKQVPDYVWTNSCVIDGLDEYLRTVEPERE